MSQGTPNGSPPGSIAPIQIAVGPAGPNVVIQVTTSIVLPKAGVEDLISKLRAASEVSNQIVLPMHGTVPMHCR